MFPSGVALESLATGHKKMLYEVRFGKAAATSGPHPDGKMVKKVRGKTAAGVGRAVLGRRTDGQKKTAALRSPAHHRAAVEADRTIGASGIVLLRRRRPLVKIVAAMLVTVQRLLLLLQQLPCPQAKAEGEEVVVAVAAEKARATASSTSSSGSSNSSSSSNNSNSSREPLTLEVSGLVAVARVDATGPRARQVEGMKRQAAAAGLAAVATAALRGDIAPAERPRKIRTPRSPRGSASSLAVASMIA
mmetsp:Transcript_60240/g.162260  ORF Transcript_60240/g.162260 Transcript_60240/m.162260 type:complete len:247 (-) Transcript_60240:703-1443(-)